MRSLGFDSGFALAQRRPGAAGAFDFTAGTLPPGATLARASAAHRTASSGLIEAVAANVARFDHDPATLALRGLTIEAAATNRVRNSATFGAATWVSYGSGTAIGSATPTAPTGAPGGALLQLAGSVAGGIYQSVPGLTAGATCSISLWVRRPTSGGATKVRITTNNGTAWSTGISQAFALSATWTRIVLTGVPSAGTTANVLIGSTDATNAADPECGGDVEIWGCQLETGTAASSHIATAAAIATRAADAATLDWASRGVADGSRTVRYTFDDGSTQDVSTVIAGGIAPVPTTLSRRWIRHARIA